MHRHLKAAMAAQLTCITKHHAHWLRPECLSIQFEPPMVLQILGCNDWCEVQQHFAKTPGAEYVPKLINALFTQKQRLCSCRQYKLRPA